MEQHACYHCGLPIPDDVHLSTEIDGASRDMCCAGCQAVAMAIVANGLESYYSSRDAMPESPREAMPAFLDQLLLFDRAEFQKTFVRELGEHEREASLLLEGITCAACIWLNEEHISRQPGVTAVDINYATRRARVRWDDTRIKLSDILAAIAAIGYRAHPYDAGKNEVLARKERREALWRVWVAGFGMMQVMMYAFPMYIARDGDMTADIASLLRWASLILTTPVVLYSSAPFFRGAWRDLRLLRVGMDVPVALGIGASYAASIWATLMQSGEVYFDSISMFVFFLLGGRFLEMTARQKAVSVTEALAKLQPAIAERIDGYPAERQSSQVAVDDLRAGEVVLVRPGEHIPVDGVVLEGSSCADESLLTGESRPVTKQPGAHVTGGSINVESPLFLQVEQVGEGTRLSSIIRLMERAAMEKPRVVELADRVASWFVAILLVVAVGVAIGWYLYDPGKALAITVSVLVVTCPCALSLATPIALTVAGGALARDGLLVTRGHAIEALARATHFVFDKTGTLTKGNMRLLDIVTTGRLSRDEVLAVAVALESSSEHPIARAISLAAGPLARVATEVVAESGAGVAGVVDGSTYRLGKPEYVVALSGPFAVPAGLADGQSLVAMGDDSGVLAWFLIGDEMRPEAPALIAALTAAGKSVSLFSGDSVAVVRGLGKQLGIGDVRSGMTPQQKHVAVQELQSAGAIVAMVGDGVNDAPVLAQAQVSVAMGGGAQLARTQADLVLLSDNLDHLRRGIARAGFVLRVIRQNLVWAFAYNAVALPLAIAGYVTPWLAGIGMSASSLLVVLNSLRIQNRKID